jgi:hypothetical protein
MALLDRIDPPPVRHVYRWDLDKTYLRTEFDTLRDCCAPRSRRRATRRTSPRRGADARAARGGIAPNRVCVISGSPRQMRPVLTEKLRLDARSWTRWCSSPPLEVLRGASAPCGPGGYKLPTLLESGPGRRPARARRSSATTPSRRFVYRSTPTPVRRGGRGDALRRPRGLGTYEDVAVRVLEAARAVERGRRGGASSSTSTGTPARLLPPLRAAPGAHLQLLPGRAGAHGRRPPGPGVGGQGGGGRWSRATATACSRWATRCRTWRGGACPWRRCSTRSRRRCARGGGELASLLRPARHPSAFAKRLAALGALPPPPPPVAVDYLSMLEEAFPRSAAARTARRAPDRRASRGPEWLGRPRTASKGGAAAGTEKVEFRITHAELLGPPPSKRAPHQGPAETPAWRRRPGTRAGSGQPGRAALPVHRPAGPPSSSTRRDAGHQDELDSATANASSPARRQLHLAVPIRVENRVLWCHGQRLGRRRRRRAGAGAAQPRAGQAPPPCWSCCATSTASNV